MVKLLPNLPTYQAPGDPQDFGLVPGGEGKERSPLSAMRPHEADLIVVGSGKICSDSQQGFRGLPLVVCPMLELAV